MSNKVPLPIEVSRVISDLAARRAREGLQRRRWSQTAQLSIQPAPSEGHVGIRTALKYLHIQNKGFGPFLMTALEGKTVPIKTPSGTRFIRVRGVGLPGMGYQNRKYEAYKGPIWREQRWRHPGIRPERFMENAISQAILESRPKLQQMVVEALMGRQSRGPTPNDMPPRAFWGRGE